MNVSATRYPSIRLPGIQDKSSLIQTSDETNLPLHTPLFTIMSEMGRGDINIIPANDFIALYGRKTLEPNSDYYTHQSEAVQVAIENNNAAIAIKRIIPSGAYKASVSLGVDSLLPDDWFIGGVFKAHSTDTYTPILECEVDNEGYWGNDYAFTLTPVDSFLNRVHGVSSDVQLYSFKLYKTDEVYNRVHVVDNNLGEAETIVSLQPEVFGRGDIPFFINDRIKENFIDNTTSSVAPIIGRFEFYPENYAKLAKKSKNYDNTKPLWQQDIGAMFSTKLIMFDPFKGEHHVQLVDGTDGYEEDVKSYVLQRLARLRKYDEACRDFFNSLTVDNHQTDIAKYPYNFIWDTGYSYQTKLAIRTALNTRKDMFAVISCFSVADYSETEKGKIFNYLSKQDEVNLQGVAARLQSAFRLFRESDVYGTPAVRAMLVKNSGVINNNPYKKRRSLAIFILGKVCRWIGGSDGKFKQKYSPDMDANRTINNWSDLDVYHQPDTVLAMNMDNGLVYAQPKDTRFYFIPYYQTIYDDITSVLKDFITVVVCCAGEQVGAEAWRRFSGSTDLGKEARREQMENYILEKMTNRFGDNYKFSVVSKDDSDIPESVFAEHTILRVYSNKVKVSNVFIIQTYRMSDLDK